MAEEKITVYASIDNLRKQLLGNKFDTFEAFETELKKVEKRGSKPEFKKAIDTLRKEAEELFEKDKSSAKNQEEPRSDVGTQEEPAPATEDQDGPKKTTPAPDTHEPKQDTKTDGEKNDLSAEEIPAGKEDSSDPQKAEEPKLNKYEKRFATAEQNLANAKQKLQEMLGNLSEEQRKYFDNVKSKVDSKEATYLQVVGSAKEFDKVLKTIQAQLKKIDKLQEVSDKAKDLRDNMNGLEEVYSVILSNSNKAKDDNKAKKSELEDRKTHSNQQEKRLHLSEKKIGRMMMVGALKKNLVLVPAKKLSFVLRRMGKIDLAEALEAKVSERVNTVDKNTTEKVNTEFDERVKIEKRVDAVYEGVDQAMAGKQKALRSSKKYLEKWKDDAINKRSPFKKLLAELAVNRQDAIKTKAYMKYKNAVDRTARNMERGIVHGTRHVEDKEAIRNDLLFETQDAREAYKEDSSKTSKVFKFVDKGNQIRKTLDRARSKADFKREGKFAEIETDINHKNYDDRKKSSGRIGSKLRVSLAARGRQKRFDNMRLDAMYAGENRRGLANIAAFLGFETAAKALNRSAIKSQDKFVDDKHRSRVVNGSRLERAALNVGAATLDAPQIAGEVVAGQVMAAQEYVKNVRNENSKAVCENVEQRYEAVMAALAERGFGPTNEAQEKAATIEQTKEVPEQDQR